MLRYTPITPVAGTPHPVFDLLIRSLSGDKRENITHLERVIVAKYTNPGNHMLPVVSFSDGGATGKSLFTATVMTAMFGRSSVWANAAMSDVAGQFNGHLAGKLVVMINENCEDSYNHNKIKAIAGSPTITFTDKGRMPFLGDNTALLFVTGNSVAGSIRVDGGDVDRRFSMIRGTNKLSHYTAAWLETELGSPVATTDAEEWMKEEGQKILSDPQAVAVWLHALIERQGEVRQVAALHGVDYRAAVAAQTPIVDQVFELFFSDPAFTYIRRSVLYQDSLIRTDGPTTSVR